MGSAAHKRSISRRGLLSLAGAGLGASAVRSIVAANTEVAEEAGERESMKREESRLGIIGCFEGTHGKVWAKALTSPEGKKYGMRPTKLWDVAGEAAQALANSVGAKAVDEPSEAGEDVDGILITELFPDNYLELARQFLIDGKRVFFNRPFAASIADAREIIRLAEMHGARIYSASALDHTDAGKKARDQIRKLGTIRLFNMTGPSDHLYFYLPHAIAALTSVLGTGIAKVQAVSLAWRPNATHLASAPVVLYTKYGKGAKYGQARGVIEMMGPGSKWYGFRLKLFGAKAECEEIKFEVSYDKLLQNMARFFRTGKEPIPHEEMLEKTALFYAAIESACHGGSPVKIEEIMQE